MPTINGKACVANGVAVDKVFSNGKQVYSRNLLTGTSGILQTVTNAYDWNANLPEYTLVVTTIDNDTTYTARAWISPASYTMCVQIVWKDSSGVTRYRSGNVISAGTSGYSTWTGTITAGSTIQRVTIVFSAQQSTASAVSYKEIKLEKGSVATPWSPAPEDHGYNEWCLDTYYNTDSLFIPYSGTVPCNQLEQGFAIEFTSKESASSLSFKIDDTEFTSSNAVAAGDVIRLNGFSYTQNGLSIVSKTNKAYFILQPDKPNRITCNVHGTVKIIGLQNLYA